jgi:tRNA-Thr(GGU) m(6)t(6)A37 methyltransferase TsaA
MKTEIDYELRPVGFIQSPLTERKNAPRQGSENAPAAWIELLPEFADALLGMDIGAEVWVLTWLHQGRRDTLQVYPRGDRANLLTGVFFTRSPDRPNPIGLHRTTVVELNGTRIKLANIEAINGTPVIDIKPVLSAEKNGR